MVYMLKANYDVAILGPIRVWAENGFVCVEDSRDISDLSGKAGGITQLHPKTALLQLKGIVDMLGNGTQDGVEKYADAWERQMRFVEQATEIIRKAQEQGAHDDKSMNRDKKRRRATTIVMPGTGGFKL